MITLTFHVATLLIGVLIGFFIGAGIVLLLIFRNNGAWDIGFSEGWKCGAAYETQKEESDAE